MNTKRFPHLIQSAAMLALFSLGSFQAQGEDFTPRRIEADYDRVAGTNNHYENYCVGAGRASELLRKDALKQLRDVRENCGFRYLRFHAIFHDEMGVYSVEDQKERYNFQYVDMVYDSLLDLGIRPFVELSFMPKAMASGDKTIFWWKGNVTPPADPAKWQGLISEFARHLEHRYGREEVKNWYFEVWNEPNLRGFFDGTQEDYFKLYDITARAVKAVCPEYRVGGPATAGCSWVVETIQFCNTNKVPLDFISTHRYGVDYHLDEFGKRHHFLKPAKDSISSEIKKVREQIAASPMPMLPLHVTEWSACPSPRDAVHDSYVSAPFILNTLKRTAACADSMSYWTYTDIFEEAGPPPSPFHGGFGLINFQGLRKPAFYAYKFLNQLGDEFLKNEDPESTLCRSKEGIQMLVWNYTPLPQSEPNKIFFKKDLPAKEVPPALISVKSVPEGEYELQVFGVGYRRNDVYADFLDMGSPNNLSREQVKTLAEKNNGAPLLKSNVRIGKGESFTHTLPMRENDVYLLLLTRKSSN